MAVNLCRFRQFVVRAAQIGRPRIADGLCRMSGLLQVRPYGLLFPALVQSQTQRSGRREFFLVPPNAGNAFDFTLTQSHHDGGFVGVLHIFLLHTAAALAALPRRGLMLVGRKIAIPNQIARHARAPVHHGQSQSLRRLLHLQRQNPLFGSRNSRRFTAHKTTLKHRCRFNCHPAQNQNNAPRAPTIPPVPYRPAPPRARRSCE